MFKRIGKNLTKVDSLYKNEKREGFRIDTDFISGIYFLLSKEFLDDGFV